MEFEAEHRAVEGQHGFEGPAHLLGPDQRCRLVDDTHPGVAAGLPQPEPGAAGSRQTAIRPSSMTSIGPIITWPPAAAHPLRGRIGVGGGEVNRPGVRRLGHHLRADASSEPAVLGAVEVAAVFRLASLHAPVEQPFVEQPSGAGVRHGHIYPAGRAIGPRTIMDRHGEPFVNAVASGHLTLPLPPCGTSDRRRDPRRPAGAPAGRALPRTSTPRQNATRSRISAAASLGSG